MLHLALPLLLLAACDEEAPTEAVAVPTEAVAAPASARHEGVSPEQLSGLLSASGLDADSLVYPAIKGPMGPTDSGVLVLTRSPDGAGHFEASVLIPEPSDLIHHELPLKAEFAADEITAARIENIDLDPELEIIILATYLTGMGPEGAIPFHDNAILDWDGDRFVLAASTEKIAQLSTIEEVLAALR